MALFSLEMSREAIAQRLLSSESGVDSKRVRLGIYSEVEEREIMKASGELSEAALFIDDSPMLRVVEMRSKARRLHFERGGIDLLIVDYLQLMQGDGRTENRVQEITEISRSLKALARELDVPLLAVSLTCGRAAALSRTQMWCYSYTVMRYTIQRRSGRSET